MYERGSILIVDWGLNADQYNIIYVMSTLQQIVSIVIARDETSIVLFVYAGLGGHIP